MATGMAELARRCQPALAGRERASNRGRAVVARPPVVEGGGGVRLVARGRSNREIGEQLFISSNTAANHVRAILQKTATANRAEATAYAARHGLLD